MIIYKKLHKVIGKTTVDTMTSFMETTVYILFADVASSI